MHPSHPRFAASLDRQSPLTHAFRLGVLCGWYHLSVMAESPFAPSRYYPSGSNVNRHLGQHYPTLIATTSSCARPSSSATLCLTLVVPVFAGRCESLRDVAVPDIISAIYT